MQREQEGILFEMKVEKSRSQTTESLLDPINSSGLYFTSKGHD